MIPAHDDDLHFDAFQLQPRERRLLVRGQPVVLGGRAFDLLLALAERPDQLVTHDELLDRVWPDVVVEGNNIAVQISSLRKVLGADAISTVPGRGYRFMRRVQRAGAAVALPSSAAAVGDERPPLFGRDTELAQAQQLIVRQRLVTLVGPAGVGKTALARALMQRPPCAGRSAWLGLATLVDGHALPSRMAEAMQWRLAGDEPLAALVQAATAALAADTAPRWLVLDNAEHLVDAVARVVDALAAVEGLHVLATSQAPLGARGEQVLRLEPLGVPADDVVAERALAHGAVALFVDRARTADRRFVLTPERVPAVVQICRELDGLPLALEMAAARLPLLGLVGLQQSLAQRLRVLARTAGSEEPRHRTLQAALDWSHAQLDEAERTVLRRCAVFNGGFTLELFTAVVAGAADVATLEHWDAVDALGGLVARSLVVADGLDVPRYRLLETVRAYAAQQLLLAGEAQAVARRHAEALRDFFAVERARVADGQPVAAAMPRCLPEFDNLGSAIDWCLQHAPALAVELVARAGIFTVFSLRRRDAELWLAACEPHVDAVHEPRLQGEYWLERTRARVLRTDARSAESARRALEIFTAIGDELGEFQALGALLRGATGPDAALEQAAARVRMLAERHAEWPTAYRMSTAGMLARWEAINGRFERALALRNEEAQWAQAMGNPPMQRAALSNVVCMLGRLGRHDEAIQAGRALLRALADQPDQANRAYTCLFVATSLAATGRLDEATAVALDGEAVMKSLGLPAMTPLFGDIAARRGWPRSAARLIGWAAARHDACGVPLPPEAVAQRDEALALARRQLGDVALGLELGQGRRLDDRAAQALLRADRDAGPGGAEAEAPARR